MNYYVVKSITFNKKVVIDKIFVNVRILFNILSECYQNSTQYIFLKVLEHPPYSPDISPRDFDLIPKAKEPLYGRRFAT